jgi:hypothetical protein
MANETPQGVALELLRLIAFSEGKEMNTANLGNMSKAPNRAWILGTYAQCMEIVGNPTHVKAVLSWDIPK